MITSSTFPYLNPRKSIAISLSTALRQPSSSFSLTLPLPTSLNMQRQSLGSPGSKLRVQEGDVDVKSDDQNRRVSSSSSISTANTDHDEFKLEKPHRPLHPKPEKIIHFIPILTVVCFVILYLSSHEPSQDELANFNGFRHPSEQTDSSVNMEDSMRFVHRGGIFAVRSLRNLQEIRMEDSSSTKSRISLNRKLGYF